MTTLESFAPQMRVAVIGATGGIGNALVKQLSTHARVAAVYAFSRTPDSTLLPMVVHEKLDLTDEESIARCAKIASADGLLDLVIVATGVLWSDSWLSPEKSMRDLDFGKVCEVFAINTAGPSIVAKHFLPKMRRLSLPLCLLALAVLAIIDSAVGMLIARQRPH